jgi:hypothetical protein
MSSKTLHKSIAYVKAKRPVHSLVPGIAWLCLSFFHHRVTVSLHPLLDVQLLSHNLDLWLWLSQPSVTELHAACCIQYWLTDWHAACYISDSDLLLIPNSLCDPPARRRHVSKAFVILENVQKRQTENIVTEELMKLKYTVQAFYANSSSFGLPQSRTRLYVLAVDSEQCKIVHGPDQWQAWMEASSLSWIWYDLIWYDRWWYE